jgi:hydrogenase maturation protease
MARRKAEGGGELRSATGGDRSPAPRVSTPAAWSPRLLIAGVGDRWRGDASFGPLVCERLAGCSWPPEVRFVELGEGPLSLAQALAAAAPPYDRLLLLAGVPRGRPLATLRRYRWRPAAAANPGGGRWSREPGAQGLHPLELQLSGALGLGVLPPEAVVFELEPVTLVGEDLSRQAAAAVPGLLEVVRREVLAGGAHLAA